MHVYVVCMCMRSEWCACASSVMSPHLLLRRITQLPLLKRSCLSDVHTSVRPSGIWRGSHTRDAGSLYRLYDLAASGVDHTCAMRVVSAVSARSLSLPLASRRCWAS